MRPASIRSRWISPGIYAATAAITAMLLIPAMAIAQAAAPAVNQVRVMEAATTPGGLKLQVDGKDFMVLGMNWGYMPIGENYMYSLWNQSDEFIKEVLAREMPMLQGMGVNAIRQYVGIPPRWVKYIYEQYGIYTMINHPLARYGYTLNGAWIPNVDYANEKLRAALVADISGLVESFRGTPGVLMWLLGNENNYGLSWTSFETEAFPEGEHERERARPLYSLFEEVAKAIKQIDTDRPVAIANGDVQYIDVIAQECKSIDVFGTNVYRGRSARDLFQVVFDKMGLPVMFTEFGADAWNAKEMREDQVTQARYLLWQWQEIYEQSSGKGRVGNAIGGFIFQWSDGWWKFGQESRLDIHDTNASWPNAGYPEDYVEGENNMNEEWWGIMSKGPRDHRGHYTIYPRAAFYALREAFRLDPYAPTTDIPTIQSHFGTIEPVYAQLLARGDDTKRISDESSKVRVSGLRLEFETFNTGGANISTPPIETPQPALPAFLGFDHQQSFYTDFEVRPAQNVIGNLSLNILGNVGVNQIDEIFYENRGRRQTITVDGDPVDITGLERLRVYQANISWDDKWFQLEGFYRTGHTHWGYEGDFFGLYRDAYYGENLDIYNGDAPIGAEIAGKKFMKGFKLAYGPQLWWGANPQVMVKYRRSFDRFDCTAIYQDEFAPQTQVNTSFVIPLPPTRRATLHVKTSVGKFGLEVGGMWAGSTKEGEAYQVIEGEDTLNYRVLADTIRASDTWAAKAKVTFQSGRWNCYAQAAHMGVVADGGPTSVVTFTGWNLKDSGFYNQDNFMAGLAVNVGKFQFGPNFLWQKPIVGPVPGNLPDPISRPRNVVQDPFAVRPQREMTAGELVITYDPTPATWMWAWDNDVREDARLALSLGFVFRHQPTTQDASIGILEDGRTFFPFPGAPPPKDLWDVNIRFVSRLSPRTRLVGHIYFGPAQPNGWTYDAPDPTLTRFIDRFGADFRLTTGPLAFAGFVKVDDWGPYDYHRDFNLTFPLHVMGDVSYSLGAPQWFGFPQTKLGVSGIRRTLDKDSNRYVPNPDEDLGNEWEIRTYMHVSL